MCRILRVICVLALLSPVLGTAQENASITGTVTDAHGAIVVNASLTLLNTDLGQKYTTVSNGTGNYNFPGLRIGHFTLSASAPGFQTYTQTGIALNVAETVKIDVHLKVGSVRQSVTVVANALQLQAETNEVSDLISGKQVTQLETNGRDVISLATLGMGVSSSLPDFNTVSGVGANTQISFEGTRPEHNLWMIDGAEVYDRGAGGEIDVMPSPDALAEFKTLDSNYSPEYGIASGGTITMVLKSGTSDFHGGVWEFNRNDAFEANNYISKQNKQPIPELRLNEFGGNLGGPLWIPHFYDRSRSKTFFFVNEEWRKEIKASNPNVVQTVAPADFPALGQPLVYTVPSNGKTPVVPASSDPARLAIYTADGLTPGKPFPNNTIPANLIDQNAVRFMNTGVIPKPNTTNNQYVVTTAFPTDLREDIVRVDHIINDKFQLMSHYLYDGLDNEQPPAGTNTFHTVFLRRVIPAYSGVIKLTQEYTPTFLNQTAVNFNRDATNVTFAPGAIYQEPAGWDAASFFTGNNPYHKLPEVDMGAPYGIDWTASFHPYHNAGNTYQSVDNASLTKGKHDLTFGGGYLRYTKLQVYQTETQGAYSFTPSTYSGDSYVNFLLGLAATYSQLQTQGTDYWVNNTYSLYANDNWHVNRTLALNLGIRYDALPHTWERHNQMANFIPADYNPSQAPQFNSDGSLNPNGPGFSTAAGGATPFYLNGIQLAGVNGFPRGLVKNYWKTIEPRVGFADDLFGDGKTVLRGGAGIFYERIEGQDIYNLDANPPFAFMPATSNVYFSNPSTSALNGQTAARPYFPAGVTALAYNYPIPGTAEFSLGLQRQFAPSFIGVVQYVGNSAWHQQDQRAINTLPLNSPERQAVAAGQYTTNTARIYPGYAGITSEEMASNSSYNSLQAGLRAETIHGLTVQLAYTYSHEIDIASDDIPSLASDPFNLNYDRGSGAYDRRHIFTGNFIYTLPWLLDATSRVPRAMLGNWQVSGIVLAESGHPVAPTYGPDVLGLGGGTTNRPNLVANVNGPKTQSEYFNTAAFAAPVAPWAGGTGFGDAGKDSIVSPGRLNFNMGLFKSIPLSEHAGPKLELRLETFNTFNHTQFMTVNTSYTAATFGHVTAVQDPRVLQLAAKLLF